MDSHVNLGKLLSSLSVVFRSQVSRNCVWYANSLSSSHSTLGSLSYSPDWFSVKTTRTQCDSSLFKILFNFKNTKIRPIFSLCIARSILNRILQALYLHNIWFRMALITDPFMKVKNTANVFAVGDCCTVQNEKLADFFSGLLGELGITQTGNLNHQQFAGFCLFIIIYNISLGLCIYIQISLFYISNVYPG